MTDQFNPVTQQRRLRTELRQARTDASLSQQQVADALDWSLSKVVRIEHGAVKVSVVDLRALLTLYGVSDPQRVDQLVEIARSGRKQQWWDKYKQLTNPIFIQHLALESTAVRNRQYQATTIPGLLQTRDYARGVISLYDLDKGEEVVEQYVNLRLKRQELLTPGLDREFFFVLDEAAVRRRIGSAETMREQLTHLKELNRQPNVNIQIIRFDAGAHRGMRVSFTVLEVPTGVDDDLEFNVVLQGSLSDTLIKNDPESASEYVEMFMILEGMASPKDGLDEVLDDIMSTIE